MSKPTRQAPEAWEIEALPPPSRTEWQPPADILARFITPVSTPGHESLAELRDAFNLLDDELEENRELIEMLNDNNISNTLTLQRLIDNSVKFETLSEKLTELNKEINEKVTELVNVAIDNFEQENLKP